MPSLSICMKSRNENSYQEIVLAGATLIVYTKINCKSVKLSVYTLLPIGEQN